VELVFYYDIVCPYAYLASTQIEALAGRVGVAITWRPILLGGVFRALGAPDVPARTLPPAKVRLGLLDLLRYAALYGVPLAMPADHPRRTVSALRLLYAAPTSARPRLTHALYRAYWAEGHDVADRTVLEEIARAANVADAAQRLDDPAVKQELHAATDEAIAGGVFGVPAFVVVRGGTRTLYFGQDRLHFVEKALAA
jgi:2-hydroxychromene-2-carboxylate isomerase